MKASLFLICIVIATACAGADTTFTPTTRTLFEDASFEVPADTLVVVGRISFFPTGNARNQAFMGTFTAERPARFVVFENLNYNAFLANQSFETFWESGPVTSLDFNIPATADGYLFTVDNRGSASTVKVTAIIHLTQEEILDPALQDQPAP